MPTKPRPITDYLPPPRPGTNGADWAQQIAEAERTPKRRKAPTNITGTLTPPTREGNVITLTLPLPPRELQPNVKTKINHYKLTKLIKATRDSAAFVTAMVAPETPWTTAVIDVEIGTAAKRMDDDNIWGWLKNILDGVADALSMNDRNFRHGSLVVHYGKASEGKRQVVLRIKGNP